MYNCRLVIKLDNAVGTRAVKSTLCVKKTTIVKRVMI